jgi:hypothetical protein
MQLQATDGIDGGFAEDDTFRLWLADPEVAQILASAWGQATPYQPTGTTQLGSNGMIVFSGDHQKDSVATLVSVQLARFDKRLEKVRLKLTAFGKISMYSMQLGKIGLG